jgi:hypothetical protein
MASGEGAVKRVTFLILMTWMVASAGLAGEQSKLEGAWEFVSGTFTTADGTTEQTAADRSALKVLTATHFSIVGRDPGHSFAHAGRYRLEGDEYTEHIGVAINPDVEGRSYTFDSKLDGDTWEISGRMVNLGVELSEVWRRVK